MTDSDIARRRVLALVGAGAGAVLGLGVCSCSSADRGFRAPGREKAPSPGPGAELCVLTPSVAEGPYHLARAPFRRDITEGRKGVPLTVRLTVRDQPHACAALKDAAVEIWHCDAWGSYSGHPSAHPGRKVPAAGDNRGAKSATYLRGFQTTDADGVAEFTTIFPGWCTPRAPHLHVKVHTGGRRTGGTYEGGRANWTGQLFFDDRYADAVYAKAPYSEHTGARTRLAQDTVYHGGGGKDGLMYVTGDVDHGFVATLTVGIDPTRENTGTQTGGEGALPPSSAPLEEPTPGAPSGRAVPSAATTGEPPPDSAASASRTLTP